MSGFRRLSARVMSTMFLAWIAIMPTSHVSADANETILGGSFVQQFSSLSIGYEHSCAVVPTGGVKCWGANNDGELGDGTKKDRPTPVSVVDLQGPVTAIAVGYEHTCVLLATGGVKCWGEGSRGQIGDNSAGVQDRVVPTDVTGLSSGVAAISAGAAHTCALLSTGGIKCWGDNNYGQLGTGDTTDRLEPTNVTGLTSGASAISAGRDHTCAILTAGGMKCWGDNSFGQLGDNTVVRRLAPTFVAGLSSNLIRVNAISAGKNHTCAVLSVGTKCWGENEFGQVGDNTNVNRRLPTSVAGLANGVVGISTGGYHTCALLSTGGIKCWGDNLGQLGTGDLVGRPAPTDVIGLSSGATAIAAGHDHSCAMLSTGAVKCWGYNESGQIGNGESVGSLATPTNVSDLAELVGPTTTSVLVPTTTPTTGGPTTTTTTATTSTPGSNTIVSTTTSTTTIGGGSTNNVLRIAVVRVGSSVKITSVLRSLGISVAPRSKINASPLTPRACSTPGGNKVKGLKTGTCKLKVTITAPASKKKSIQSKKRVQVAIRE